MKAAAPRWHRVDARAIPETGRDATVLNGTGVKMSPAGQRGSKEFTGMNASVRGGTSLSLSPWSDNLFYRCFAANERGGTPAAPAEYRMSLRWRSSGSAVHLVLDHLVGALEQPQRQVDAERPWRS